MERRSGMARACPARTLTTVVAGMSLAVSAVAQNQTNMSPTGAHAGQQTGKVALPPRSDAQAPTTQPGSNPPARKLTLQEAVTIALQNSKALRIAAEGVERSRGRVGE